MDLTGIVNYTLQRCKSIQNLIRVPTQAARRDRVIYRPIIQFTSDEVLKWLCDCFTGAGFLGCCSHIVSTLWILSWQRWQTQKRHMPPESCMNLATDTMQTSNFYDFFDDDDDDDNSRYSLA